MKRFKACAFAFLGSMLVSSGASASLDSDSDGVVDSADAEPCDPSVASVVWAPGSNTHALVMYEDLYPQLGDRDFNDVIVSYRYKWETSASGSLTRFTADYDLRAAGGAFDSGLALHLPVAASAATTVTLFIEGQASATLVPSGSDQELTFDIANDLRALAFPGKTAQVNVDPQAQAVQGQAFRVVVEFKPGTTMPVGSPYDLFTFRTGDRAHELHLPQYSGSSKFRSSLLNSGDDGSTSARKFVSKSGLPFALHLPYAAEYPSEGTSISSLFPEIVTFASSAGASGTGFYTTPKAGFSYPTQTPVRSLPFANVDTSCVPPAGQDSANPGATCASLLQAGVTSDGLYWIDPDGSGGRAAFQAYCDMTTDGGGWTAIIAPQDPSLAYLSRFDLVENTVSSGSYTVKGSYGAS